MKGQGDLIETFKLLERIDKLYLGIFFKLSVDSKVSEQTYRIVINSFRLDIRTNFFMNRVVNARNELPQYMVDVETVNSFKARLDEFYKKNVNLIILCQEYLNIQRLVGYKLICMSTSAQINQLKYTTLYYTIP